MHALLLKNLFEEKNILPYDFKDTAFKHLHFFTKYQMNIFFKPALLKKPYWNLKKVLTFCCCGGCLLFTVNIGLHLVPHFITECYQSCPSAHKLHL